MRLGQDLTADVRQRAIQPGPAQVDSDHRPALFVVLQQLAGCPVFPAISPVARTNPSALSSSTMRTTVGALEFQQAADIRAGNRAVLADQLQNRRAVDLPHLPGVDGLEGDGEGHWRSFGLGLFINYK